METGKRQCNILNTQRIVIDGNFLNDIPIKLFVNMQITYVKISIGSILIIGGHFIDGEEKMDFYSFVNSRDIREHLKKIKYQFTAVEAAWIVWKCKHVTFSEKHQAWSEIIGIYPDCEIEKRSNTAYQPSLHTFLKELMDFENRCVVSVKTDEPYTFFSYEFLKSKEDVWDDDYCYPEVNFNTCFESAIETCRAYRNNQDTSDSRIRIKKQWFDGSGSAIEVEFAFSGEVIKIINYGECTEEELNLVDFGFDGMWFDFPNPFKKGDIICNPGRFSSADFECDYGPCVLEEEVPVRRCVEIWKKPGGGDCSDMVVNGLFQNEDGTVFDECTANYMNFEYYRGELDGKKRILKAISNYLKGNISLELLLAAYHTILTEEWSKDTSPRNITDKGLILAGLKGE